MAKSSKLENVVRWLNLVPYFSHHEESTLMEAAENLGVDAQDLLRVMRTLTCCGYGKFHGELFDLDVDYKGVHILDDLGMNKPLRLTPTEASAFLLTLESLEEMPGLVDVSAVRSAAAKIRAIMDDRASAIVDSLSDVNPTVVSNREELAAAIERGTKVKLSYWSASKDQTTERVIDPLSIFVREDDVYVQAWEQAVEDFRTFRVDRILSLEVFSEPISQAIPALDQNATDSFRFDGGKVAHVRLNNSAAWLADEHAIEFNQDTSGSWLEGTMNFGSEEWLVRFALAHADVFEVTGPAQLVELVSESARKAAALYS